MKRHKTIFEYFKGKQIKSAASSDGTAVPQPSTVDHQPSNREECSSTPTTLTEPNLAEASHGNCSSECCRDLTTPHQPSNPDVLKITKRVQGTGSSQRTRSLQYQWFKDFAWLTLCETRGKLFCTQCRCCAKKNLAVSKNEPAFAVNGFNNWKNAVNTFREHTNSKHHKDSVAQFQILVSQQPSVAAQLDKQLQSNQKLKREMLLKQLSSLRFLAGQGIPIDGNEPENSNLYKLMQLRSEDCPSISRWLSDKNYMSHDIVNEMIHLISLDVLRKVLSPIQDGHYAILADESRDISNKEQLVTVLRWVDDAYTVREDFIGLFDLPKTDAQTIFNVLNDILTRCNVSPGLCRGQAYDGAANMAGHLRGVSARFKQQNPAAIFVHCLAHCLNLCLQDAAKKCKMIRDALDIVHDVAQLI